MISEVSAMTPTPRVQTQPGVEYVVLDLETTGLSPRDSAIVEIALIGLNGEGEIVEEWTSLIDPGGGGEIGASQIHGITRAMLTEAPTFSELSEEVISRLEGHIIVGHVVEFDLGHLIATFDRLARPIPALREVAACTRDLSRPYLQAPRTLADCCRAFGVELHDAHSALGDTRATALLFRALLGRLRSEGSPRFEELLRQRERARSLSWEQILIAPRSSTPLPRGAQSSTRLD
jgi:DNA polymerase-3 subunit epsilon